jgi:radical SAM superfamily enzyme YgiQ (UPF0313 family)
VSTRLGPVIDDLDSLPWPARDLLPALDSYVPQSRREEVVPGWRGPIRLRANMLTSRGCIGRCTFCANRNITGGQPTQRLRREETVIAEAGPRGGRTGPEAPLAWRQRVRSAGSRAERR